MTMSNGFEQRRRGAEEAFFARQDEELRALLRKTADTVPPKAALSEATGITDDTVLDRLASLGLSAEAVSALTLLPLVVTAWSDNAVGDRERAALLSAAEAQGLRPTDAGYRLLDRWLAQRPDPALIEAWKDYVRHAVRDMTVEERSSFRTETLARARSVAQASGGMFGLGSISTAERAALDDLERAFAA